MEQGQSRQIEWEGLFYTHHPKHFLLHDKDGVQGPKILFYSIIDYLLFGTARGPPSLVLVVNPSLMSYHHFTSPRHHFTKLHPRCKYAIARRIPQGTYYVVRHQNTYESLEEFLIDVNIAKKFVLTRGEQKLQEMVYSHVNH